MQDYRKLKVWQKAHSLAINTYAVSAYFRAPEAWPLRDQMLRAAISIPSNIAEGQVRHTTGEFIQFISHAEGSLAEVDIQLILGLELEFCKSNFADPAFGLIGELRRMLNVMHRKLATRT